MKKSPKKYILKIYVKNKFFNIGKIVVNSEKEVDNLLDAINATDDDICRVDSIIFNKKQLSRIKLKIK